MINPFYVETLFVHFSLFVSACICVRVDGHEYGCVRTLIGVSGKCKRACACVEWSFELGNMVIQDTRWSTMIIWHLLL